MELNDIINRINQRVSEKASARELSLRIGKNEAYINRLGYGKTLNLPFQSLMTLQKLAIPALKSFFITT